MSRQFVLVIGHGAPHACLSPSIQRAVTAVTLAAESPAGWRLIIIDDAGLSELDPRRFQASFARSAAPVLLLRDKAPLSRLTEWVRHARVTTACEVGEARAFIVRYLSQRATVPRLPPNWWPEMGDRSEEHRAILRAVAGLHVLHDVAELAAALGIDRVTLWRRCRRLFGVTPTEILRCHGAEVARDCNLTDNVARALGFSSARAMRRFARLDRNCGVRGAPL